MGRLSSFYQLKKYRLSKIFQISFFNNEVLVGFGSIGQKYTSENLEEIVALVRFFSDAVYFPSQDTQLSAFQVKTAESWRDLGLLTSVPEDLSQRYSRAELFHSMYGVQPSERRQKLLDSKVCIVGCGGIGTAIATHLVCNGVGSLTLIDADKVEESNLSRQLTFRHSDIGRPKTEALKDYLQSLNPHAVLKQETRFVDHASDIDLTPYSFGVVSGDRSGTLSAMNVAALRDGVPILHASYVNDIACWGPMVVPGVTGCFQCAQHFASQIKTGNPEDDEVLRRTLGRYTSPAISTVTMIASSFAANDIINHLLGAGPVHTKNQRCGVWSHNLKIEKQGFEKNGNCKVCGEIDDGS